MEILLRKRNTHFIHFYIHTILKSAWNIVAVSIFMLNNLLDKFNPISESLFS